ncbi:restriction endonuclease subunit S, partial [Alkalimonas mucilaginosa]
MSWPKVKLGSVCKLINGDRGQNYPSKDALFSEGIPFINAGNLQDDLSIKCSGANFISQERFNLLSNGKVSPGDILFCLRGSLGKFAIVDNQISQGAIASSLVILRPDSKLDRNFLKNYLRSTLCKREIERFENGAAQPNLSAKDLKEFEIPLPPLAEQKRIAAILDKADAIRRKRQQAIQLADDFLRAVFLEMFGDLVKTDGYEKSRKYKIKDLVDYIDYRGKTPEKSDSGIPLITAKNVKKGYIDHDPREFIPEDNYEAWMTRGHPLENDVLF